MRISDLDSIKKGLSTGLPEVLTGHNKYYIDLRVEAGEGVGAYSENGSSKVTSKDWSLALGVRVIDKSGIPAAGFYGRQLGGNDLKNFNKIARGMIAVAKARARENSIAKAGFKKKYGKFAGTIMPTVLAKAKAVVDTVPAVYEKDPRKVGSEEMTQLARSVSSAALSFNSYIKRSDVVVSTGITRQIFFSSEGSLIDQSWCSSGVTIFVLSQNNSGGKPVDLYHHTGNQLGLEALTKAKNSHHKTGEEFARQIAGEAVLLAGAKPAPEINKPVTVVLDPDLIALFAHEIIGHPSELDRALKMETGYAGRSWLFSDMQNNMVGKQVGSSLLTAFSDPTLTGGYGVYKYDDEGTKAKRVYHIKNGIYHDFMNSRQTAPVIGAEPNGHYKANNASAVPLIRMSVSAIAGGSTPPLKIIADVENGYYCVGHRIPSISESRENFQIAPRLIYEIKNGRLGQVFRDGRVTSDSKDFFMSIDALGNDFTVFPIPNCGKGQPMQAKQVGNGGPTARGRARIARGD